MDANTYPVVDSAVNLRGPQFTTNRKSWEPLIEKFETFSKAATSEGNDKYLQRHQDRGQLLGNCYLVYDFTLVLIGFIRSSRPHRPHPRLRLAVPGTLSVRRPWPERCTSMRESHQRNREHMVSNYAMTVIDQSLTREFLVQWPTLSSSLSHTNPERRRVEYTNEYVIRSFATTPRSRVADNAPSSEAKPRDGDRH